MICIGYVNITKSFKNEMFNKEEFKMAEDKFEQAKGNIKETVGNATDNKDLEKKVKATKLQVKLKKWLITLKIKQMMLLIN